MGQWDGSLGRYRWYFYNSPISASKIATTLSMKKGLTVRHKWSRVPQMAASHTRLLAFPILVCAVPVRDVKYAISQLPQAGFLFPPLPSSASQNGSAGQLGRSCPMSVVWGRHHNTNHWAGALGFVPGLPGLLCHCWGMRVSFPLLRQEVIVPVLWPSQRYRAGLSTRQWTCKHIRGVLWLKDYVTVLFWLCWVLLGRAAFIKEV